MKDTDDMSEEQQDMLTRFKRDVERDADILIEQRDKANEDMRFVYVDGGQWEGFLEDEYQDRAKLEFDLVSDYKNRFVGEWNNNSVGVEFKSDDSSTSDDDAELLNGIYRADFRDNSGKAAMSVAVNEVATCGFGAFCLGTKFIDEENAENDDQEIEWRPIFNAYNTVVFDQSARRADKLDARWVTELTPYTEDSFKDAFPDVEAVSAHTIQDRSFYNYTGSQALIYVATRYEVKKEDEKAFVYNNLASGEVEVYYKEDHELIKDELAKSDIHYFVRERKIIRRKIMVSRFTGKQFIEEPRQIHGKYLPIIPMYGYRAYVDGIEYYFGLIRKLKDAARSFNVQMNQLVENAASAGQEVPIFEREQIEAPDVAALWADKNNKPFLFVDPLTDENGNPIAHGPIGYNKPPMLDQSTATLIDIMPNFIQKMTGGAPQDTIDPNASGKAINAMIKQFNLSTQTINENISDSIVAGGMIYQSIAADTYNSRRIRRTLGKDGTEGREVLFKTIADEQTGKIIQANTLRGKKFKVYADIGPQYDTMREQTVEDLKGMLELFATTGAGQDYIEPAIATLLDNINGVGMGPLKDMNRKKMLILGLVDPANDEEKEFLAQQSQPKDDPNAELAKAAAQQQLAEAENLKASSVQKIAAAKKAEAETQEIYNDIGISKSNLLLKAREQVLGQRMY